METCRDCISWGRACWKGFGNRSRHRSAYFPGEISSPPEVVIPTSSLTTDDGKAGLKAESSRANEWKSAGYEDGSGCRPPTFSSQFSQPTPPEGLKDFSVRWSGFVVPAESGQNAAGRFDEPHVAR